MKNLLKNQLVWAGIVLVVLLAINISHTKALDFSNGRMTGALIDLLVQSPPILMIAIGMTLVIATSGIDLSVGSVMAVSGAVAMQYLNGASNPNGAMSIVMALILSLGVGLLCGAFSGFLVSVVKLQPFITTLIMMLAGRGIANIITGGQNAEGNSTGFNKIAQGIIFGFPVRFLVAILVLVVIGLLVRKTALGMSIESVGINPRAAEMAGIRSGRILFMVYALSGVLAAVAGILVVAYIGRVEVASTGTGAGMEMDAILAVVIGGTSLAGGKFHLGGTVLGAFIITALDQTVVYLGIPTAAIPAFKALVIIGICLLQSDRVHGWFSAPGKRRPAVPEKDETEKAVAA